MLKPGKVADNVAATVKDHGIDIVVMSAFGNSALRTLIFGSKTAYLLRSVKVPTLGEQGNGKNRALSFSNSNLSPTDNPLRSYPSRLPHRQSFCTVPAWQLPHRKLIDFT
jgi:hypothetical protein